MSEPQHNFFWDNLPQLLVEDLAPEDRKCNICFATYETQVAPEVPVQLPCSHIFGLACLKTWFAENNTCPMCRRELFPPPPLGSPAHETFTLPIRFTPELVRIIRRESMENISLAALNMARSERAQWNYIFYRRIASELPTQNQRGIDDEEAARSQSNFIIHNGVSSDSPAQNQRTEYREFVRYYHGHFSFEFRDELLSVDQQYVLYCYFQSRGCFEGMGFDIIRQATGQGDVLLYLDMMAECVCWVDDCWRTLDGQSFLPEGWEGGYRPELFRDLDLVLNSA